MRRKTRKMLVVLALLAATGVSAQPKDKNYYTQVVRMADGSEVRLLPDDISRVSVLKTTDYDQMTLSEFLTYYNTHKVGLPASYFQKYNDESSQFEQLWLPTEEAFSAAKEAMTPYYQCGSSVVGLDIDQMPSYSSTQTRKFFKVPESQGLISDKLVSMGFNTPAPPSVLATEQTVSGPVSIVGSVPSDYWLRDLTMDDWAERYTQTTNQWNEPASSYTSVRAFNSNLSEVKTVDGLSYVSFTPAGERLKPYIFLCLPQTLSTTYDIYCVIVPGNKTFDAEVTEERPNILNFQLYYGDMQGTLTQHNFSSASPTGTSSSVSMNTAFTNDLTKVDTLYVGRVDLPVAYDGAGDLGAVLSISCPISVFNSAQLAQYDRTVRLAAVLLRRVEGEANQNN